MSPTAFGRAVNEGHGTFEFDVQPVREYFADKYIHVRVGRQV
jgi:hypothetical protein